MLIRRAEIDVAGERRTLDVRIEGEAITEVASGLARASREFVLDADGATLLPGLHDHHIHLYALAAAFESVRCGPPQIADRAGLAREIAAAPARDDGWIRGVAYHESVAGALDRLALDALAPSRPLRIQHRSGALWMVNGPGLARLGLAGDLPRDAPSGVERDAQGRSTGRLFHADAWLRAQFSITAVDRTRVGSETRPDISRVSALLSRFGVTGATDATATNAAEDLLRFANDVASGRLAQRIRVMGGASLPELHGTGLPGASEAPLPETSGAALPLYSAGLERGERKIVLREDELPRLDDLCRSIREAHTDGRGAAIHCVTRAELALAVGAFAVAGTRMGDRIEHAAVAPPEFAELIARAGICVVTQPNFVFERGDTYLTDVAPADLPWLYRCGGLLAQTVAVGGGTDAPFGDPDPWLAMQAAVDRRSAAGARIGSGEEISPERALALFTTRADAPGGVPRRVAAGAPADLCLLDRPWREARERLSSSNVRATIVRGRIVFDAARS